MLDALHSLYVFIKIDLKSGYYHIKLKECDNEKYNLYEWLVMLFDLTMHKVCL